MYPNVWFLPCNETPFLNRNHPVFLAIKDRVVDCDEGRVRLAHFGWVIPGACCKTKDIAEEELFHHYETLWLDRGLTTVKHRSTLEAYYRHSGLPRHDIYGLGRFVWFDLHGVIFEKPEVTIDIEAFMRP